MVTAVFWADLPAVEVQRGLAAADGVGQRPPRAAAESATAPGVLLGGPVTGGDGRPVVVVAGAEHVAVARTGGVGVAHPPEEVRGLLGRVDPDVGGDGHGLHPGHGVVRQLHVAVGAAEVEAALAEGRAAQIVALLPLPEASATVVPEVWSSGYRATRPSAVAGSGSGRLGELGQFGLGDRQDRAVARLRRQGVARRHLPRRGVEALLPSGM